MSKNEQTWIDKQYLKRHYEILRPFERKVYSQSGEDGIIEEIFRRIDTGSKYAVEFGVEDGSECNTRLLKEKGWEVLQMDGRDDNPTSIKQEFITAENINELFAKYGVPEDLDMLCIDIDSNDFWVWKALDEKYRPRLIVAEYNAHIPPNEAKTVAYDPKLVWDGTSYFGASLLALYWLAKTRGYDLVYCTDNGANAFFVRADLTPGKLPALIPTAAYRGPSFGRIGRDGAFLGHPPTTREFVEIDEDLNPVSSQKN
jgi:hypothetical protein